jgi:hypothetical protein
MTLSSTLGGAARAAGPANDFSPETVFALPAHRDIDDRCQDARQFADHASQTTDDIDGPGAFIGALAFYRCFRLARLEPDPDAQRYLYLASATALYLAAMKSDREIAARMFLKADSMARELGAVGPDHLTQIVAYVGDPDSPHMLLTGGAWWSSADSIAMQGTVVRINPLGYAHAERFTDVADSLLAAIGKSVETENGSRSTDGTLPQASSTERK